MTLQLCAGPGWKRRDGKIVNLTPTGANNSWAMSHPWTDGGMTFTDAGLWSHDGRSQSLRDIVGRDLTAVTPGQAEPPAIKPQPERVKILHEGAALTSGARDAEYGPPQINMNAAGRLKQLARELATRDISPAEWEALEMALTKLSRLLVGTAKRDTYIDMAAYVAIAGEIALSI